MTNKVWIELDRAATQDPARQVVLVNQMLRKLGVSEAGFGLNRDANGADKLVYVTDSSGSYVDCPDWGHWLSLDYLAK